MSAKAEQPRQFEAAERPRIDGVETTVLRVIADERGRLMEILRADDPLFRQFGQVYMTTAYPGVVIAWLFQRRDWDHFVCLWGMM